MQSQFFGKIVVAAAALMLLPTAASAVPVDLDYDYNAFECAGCYEYNINNKTFNARSGGGTQDLGAILYYYWSDRDAPRTRVIYEFNADSSLYIDVANSAVYIAAGAESIYTNRGTESPPGEFFNTDVQIYFQFVDGVTIETDAHGIPTSISVAGASANNSGYYLWEDSFYAASLETKLNGEGISATWDSTDNYFNNWMMGVSSFYNHDGTVNTELGNNLTVLGDFHFDTEVPEPTTLLLLGSALGGGLLRRKKQTA